MRIRLSTPRRRRHDAPGRFRPARHLGRLAGAAVVAALGLAPAPAPAAASTTAAAESAGTAAAGTTGAATAAGSAASTAADGRSDRIVRRFGFEELELVPVRLPRPWQNLADELGLPRFGDWAVRDDRAAEGRWALRLDPDGVPMAFGVPSGVILVYPTTDYRVRCRVRTEGIAHGRAQLVAMLCDADGRTIEGSIVRSPARRSPDRWSTLEVTVPGRFPEAVSLRVELHLLQPSRPDPADDPVAAARPTLVDVRGSAWFDDVTVEHRSRVDLTTNGAGGVIVAPLPPRLTVTVHDLTTAGLEADLLVRDADGRVVDHHRIDRVRASTPIVRELALPGHGWYEAELLVRADDVLAGRRRTAFAWIPPLARAGVRGPGRLGVAVDRADLRPAAGLAAVVAATGARATTLPLWPPDDERVTTAIDAAERLLERGLEVIAELPAASRARAAAAGLDPHQVADLLAGTDEGWREDLEPLVVRFGLRVRRWTLGPRRPAAHGAVVPVADAARAAAAALRATLPGPVPVMPVPAEHAAASGPGPEPLPRVPAEAAPETVAAWLDGRTDLVELALPELGRGRDAEIDLSLRVLHAWRAGAGTVLVDLPVDPDPGGPDRLVPAPALPVLRTLADGLQGRRVVGALRLGPEVEAWLLAGEGPDDGAVVAWSRGRVGDADRTVAVRLGSGAVTRVAARGDREAVPRDVRGRHEMRLGPAPAFFEGVDLELLRFRAALAIAPDEVPAVYRAHELELVMSNPWDVAIAGLVELGEDGTRRIRPHRVAFTLQPGETQRKPITVVFDRTIAAGEQRVPATVTVESVETERFVVDLPVEVGWKDVEVGATWRISVDDATGRRDLVVRQYVTNRGEEPVQLDAFLRGPGLGRERRPLERLEPGATAVRTFLVEDGVRRLSGAVLRYGVSERGGPAQLNRPLRIPPLAPAVETVRARGDAGPP